MFLYAMGTAAAFDDVNEATPTIAPNMTPEGAQDDAEITPESASDASSSDGWKALITETPHLPSNLVVVNKSQQQLSLYERKSPLKLQENYICTTGQRIGDKQVSGDRRTPEGVYFVVSKIDKGLDFGEYGGIAHTLNYPNPVDRLQGKTGYGIWIHSRGRPITPRETKGCIAVNLDDIARLGSRLPFGTAVVVADTIATDATDKAQEAGDSIAQILEKKTRDWNASWAARSKSMFDFYWPEAYSKAQGESFQAFRHQKERLFETLPWIQIIYGDIKVLRGPDYWVSWFPQYYRAPNVSTEGVRRLYWQPDNRGELRIVGMEWIPQNFGMEAAYLEMITPSVAAFIERWKKVWLAGDVNTYMTFYAPHAKQGNRTGVASIKQQKVLTWQKNKPARVELTGLRVMLVQGGVKVDMTQVYSDSSGYRDKGVKTLLLHPNGKDWLIVSEDWSAVQ